jgi:hypothetical protein
VIKERSLLPKPILVNKYMGLICHLYSIRANFGLFLPGLGLHEIWEAERRRVIEERRNGPRLPNPVLPIPAADVEPKSEITKIRDSGFAENVSRPEPLLSETTRKPKFESARYADNSYEKIRSEKSQRSSKRHFLLDCDELVQILKTFFLFIANVGAM